ncbi:MAG: hypothetical protein ACRDNJ_17200, partial [Solirubrobacteraceae bacterium]
PADRDQALALAAELQALSAESSDLHHRTVEQVAADLLDGGRQHTAPHEPMLTHTSWDIAR